MPTGDPGARARGTVVAGLDESAVLQATIAPSDDAIIGKTLDGVVVSWDGGAEAMYGYTADEAIGRSITFLVPPALQHETARPRRAA